MKDNTKATDWQVVWKTGVFSTFLLALGLFACLFVEKGLQNILPAYADDIRIAAMLFICLLYTSPSPRDRQKSRMPSSA